MRTESREVFLRVGASEAFDFLVDYRNDPTWRAELDRVELVAGEPGVPGCEYAGVVDWYGLHVPHEYRLIEARRPEYIRMVSDAPDFEISVRYFLDDAEGGCLMTARYTLNITGPLVVVEPFAWALFTGWVKDGLPRLEQHFSEGARVPIP